MPISGNPFATDRVIWLSVASSVMCFVAFLLVVRGSGVLVTVLAAVIGVTGSPSPSWRCGPQTSQGQVARAAVEEPEGCLSGPVAASYVGAVPIVEVAFASKLPEATLRALAGALPHVVSLAVECPEEPYDGDLKPGDVELLLRERSPLDDAGLDVLVLVRSKWFASRAEDRDNGARACVTRSSRRSGRAAWACTSRYRSPAGLRPPEMLAAPRSPCSV